MPAAQGEQHPVCAGMDPAGSVPQFTGPAGDLNEFITPESECQMIARNNKVDLEAANQRRKAGQVIDP